MVCPVGNSVPEAWRNILEGKSGIRHIDRFDCSDFPAKIAGMVKGFDAEEIFGRKEARKLDPFAQLALAAADEAIKQAGIEADKTDPSKIGVCIGSGVGGFKEMEEQLITLMNRGVGRVSPFMIPKLMLNAASGHVAIRYGFEGPNWSVATACASGTHAIGEAFKAIQNGTADVIVTGGSEYPVIPMGLAGFCAARALSTRDVPPEKASCPFDAERDGFVMGEGAGVLVLEEEEHAKKRGAEILARVRGYGSTCDAFHITAPKEDGSGAARAMKLALKDAGIAPEEVDYINAHGTSTKLNDVMETKAIKAALGENAARKVAVSSTKSMTGHLLGGSGGIESIFCIMSIKEGVIPPTINLEHPDPECDLDYVPNTARETAVKVAVKNSFGFGGHNAVVVFSAA